MSSREESSGEGSCGGVMDNCGGVSKFEVDVGELERDTPWDSGRNTGLPEAEEP